MSLPRLWLNFLTLQSQIAQDPDVSIPANQITFGGEFLSDNLAPRSIRFVPRGGPVVMSDLSGVQESQQTPPSIVSSNPHHRRTFQVGFDIEIWGGLPPQWLPETDYVAGQIVNNSPNGYGDQWGYQCTTSGESGDSGGPTGEGTGILDGSVVWDYVPSTANLIGYDDCFDMLQAIDRALFRSKISGSYRWVGEPEFPATRNDAKGGFGRTLTARLELYEPIVAPTLPTVTRPTLIIQQNFVPPRG